MNIWDFSIRLTRRLLVWSVFSVLVSTLTVFSADLFLRGLAIQFFAWGAIDGAIAIFGARVSAKKKLRAQESASAESEAKESRWLSRILWVNTGLDVLYILGGLWLMQTWGTDSPLWRGHGVGIIIQGGFLFFFDFYHAFSLRNIRTN
jgi:hypothetical protein